MDLDLDLAVPADPTAFKKFLEDFDSQGHSPVDLYNALINRSRPREVVALAQAALEFFKVLDRADEILLFMELEARLLAGCGVFEQAMAALWNIVHLPHAHAETVALEVIEDIIGAVETLGASLDLCPKIYNEVEAILRHYSKLELVADLYIRSAVIYSRHGASQAAYRCLASAEELLTVLQSEELLLACVFTGMVVAIEEGDYSYALEVGERALSLYSQLEREVPTGLLSNIGVAQLNLEDYQAASEYFELALLKGDLPAELRVAVGVNLASCYRRREMFTEARAALIAAEQSTSSRDSGESLLELSMSAAQLAGEVGDTAGVIQRLQSASKRLDSVLGEVMRLHHRRELRERYIRRIERSLSFLPKTGRVGDMLLPLAASRGNAMGDWLTILNWFADLEAQSSLPSARYPQLRTILRKLRQGAPHLYGFFEKYDDPWGPRAFGEAWDDLSEFCAAIRAEGLEIEHPLQRASSEAQAELCARRLREGHCLMAMTFVGEHAALWCLIGDDYQKAEIPISEFMQWHLARLKFGQGEIERAPFCDALKALIDALAPLIDPLVEWIESSDCRSLRIVEDCFIDLPIMAFVLRNANLHQRMLLGEFEVRRVPALIESQETPDALVRAVSIVDRQEDLLLTPHEADAFTNAAGLGRATVSSDAERASLEGMLGGYDTLIVSTHGRSLHIFTDAYFAGLGEGRRIHPLNVPALQVAAPDLEIRLAVINACFAGTRSARNYQKRFRTSDAVSIPGLFLLNRRAVAFAGAWKVADTASFVMSHLIGEGLRIGLGPSAAIIQAIGRLPRMTTSETIAILEQHLPQPVQEQAVRRLSLAPEKGIFAHPYFYAGLSVHGLM